LKPTRVRHIILGLTVAAYMITYMDRVVISSAVPTIQEEFGFSLTTMSYIIASFRWGYALFQIPGGWFGDRITYTLGFDAVVARRRGLFREGWPSRHTLNGGRLLGPAAVFMSARVATTERAKRAESPLSHSAT